MAGAGVVHTNCHCKSIRSSWKQHLKLSSEIKSIYCSSGTNDNQFLFRVCVFHFSTLNLSIIFAFSRARCSELCAMPMKVPARLKLAMSLPSKNNQPLKLLIKKRIVPFLISLYAKARSEFRQSAHRLASAKRRRRVEYQRNTTNGNQR